MFYNVKNNNVISFDRTTSPSSLSSMPSSLFRET